jgi:hypothetical protein
LRRLVIAGATLVAGALAYAVGISFREYGRPAAVAAVLATMALLGFPILLIDGVELAGHAKKVREE